MTDTTTARLRSDVLEAVRGAMEDFGALAANLKTRNLAPAPRSDGSIEAALDRLLAYTAAQARVDAWSILSCFCGPIDPETGKPKPECVKCEFTRKAKSELTALCAEADNG